MGEIIKVDSSTWRKQEDAPANSLNITAKGRGNKDDEAELYQHPGILSRPDGGEICAVIEVGEQKLIIATQNYDLGKEIDKGELFLYSVVDGAIKTSAYFNKNGELIVNEGTKNAARQDDQTQTTATEDSTMIGWIATVSSFINGLAPGTITTVPTTITGKITQGTDKVKLP